MLFPHCSRGTGFSRMTGSRPTYHAPEARSVLHASDMESFLHSLDIDLQFDIDDESSVARLSQLTQKTNQFNLTTKRQTTGEMAALLGSPHPAVVSCRYSDRFGDEGVVGLAILNLDEASVDNLLINCRVIGRGVEGGAAQ